MGVVVLVDISGECTRIFVHWCKTFPAMFHFLHSVGSITKSSICLFVVFRLKLSVEMTT